VRLLVSKVKAVDGRVRELAVQAVTQQGASASPHAVELMLELLEAELDPASGLGGGVKGVLRVLATGGQGHGLGPELSPQDRAAVWAKLLQALAADKGEAGLKEAKLAALVRVVGEKELVEALGKAIKEALGAKAKQGGRATRALLLAAAEVAQHARTAQGAALAKGWGSVAQQLVEALKWAMGSATARGQRAGNSTEETQGDGETGAALSRA
jgi:hypothetical protein